MDNDKTGPRGGVTTVAPSGWQKTTVYLRRDQIRTLKQNALDRGRTMSDVLRHAIDHYFGLKVEDYRLSQHQRNAVEMALHEHVEQEKVAGVLASLDEITVEEEDD